MDVTKDNQKSQMTQNVQNTQSTQNTQKDTDIIRISPRTVEILLEKKIPPT